MGHVTYVLPHFHDVTCMERVDPHLYVFLMSIVVDTVAHGYMVEREIAGLSDEINSEHFLGAAFFNTWEKNIIFNS
jgi:hypothetical protein